MAISEPPLSSMLPVVNDMASWPKPWGNFFSQAWLILSAVEQSGVTADRPTRYLWVGRTYFDTTLGIPIWYDGSNWVSADGSVV